MCYISQSVAELDSHMEIPFYFFVDFTYLRFLFWIIFAEIKYHRERYCARKGNVETVSYTY